MPDWNEVGKTGKQGFDTVWRWADKLGAPVNKLTNKLGSEAFWPTTLDKESEKAARILRSFCKDGFYSDDSQLRTEEARNIAKSEKMNKVIKKIPEKVIKNAKGLAIFTVMRSGLWVSGAGGSGVLLGRMPNGEWSPPSGILIHTAAAGFVFGADIYDCVVVINTEKALENFRTVRATLGGELSAVAGPVGIGGIIDIEVHGKTQPVWTYMKSRGFYAGLGANGTIILERKDENAKFYLQDGIRAVDILGGKAKHVPTYDIRMLMSTIKAAQGDTDVDQKLLIDNIPAPGDMEVERMGEESHFGLPSADDPDPFGVRALEEEGFEIREAGTGVKATTELFDYHPAPSSPAYNVLHRKSFTPSPARTPSSMSVNSQTRTKVKMSNPKMVFYADHDTQTISEEERQEEMEDAARRAEMVESVAEGTITPPSVVTRKSLPPSLPARGPPPPLPPRTPGTPSVPVILAPPAVVEEHEVSDAEDYFPITNAGSDLEDSPIEKDTHALGSPPVAAHPIELVDNQAEHEYQVPTYQHLNTVSAEEVYNDAEMQPTHEVFNKDVVAGQYKGHSNNSSIDEAMQDVDINGDTTEEHEAHATNQQKEAIPGTFN